MRKSARRLCLPASDLVVSHAATSSGGAAGGSSPSVAARLQRHQDNLAAISGVAAKAGDSPTTCRRIDRMLDSVEADVQRIDVFLRREDDDNTAALPRAIKDIYAQSNRFALLYLGVLVVNLALLGVGAPPAKDPEPVAAQG